MTHRMPMKAGAWWWVRLLALATVPGLATGCGKGGESEQEVEAEPSRLQADGDEAGLTLDSVTVARIGLRTTALARAARPADLELPGVVVTDPSASSVVRAGVSGRLAAAADRPWPAFGDSLQSGEVIGAVADARPIAVPRAGVVSRVVAHPGELVQAGQELLELTDYGAPLVRLAWPEGAGAPPARVSLLIPGSPRATGVLAGPAPEADPLTGRPAMLYRVPAGGGNARPGTLVTALVPRPGPGPRGVLVPAGAVVQWDALLWTYMERAPGRYVRVRVPSDQPVPGGWLVNDGLAPGDRVVLVGAEQLLSEEFRARIVVGEEVGE